MPSFLERLAKAVGPRYRVEREVATGGMGVVVRAHDTQLDRPVAIKALRPELATAAAAQRFLREAQTLATLHHPHIVPIHDYGSAQGIDFYIMEFLEGDTVADRLARGPLPLREVRQLAEGLLDALAAAHRHGVIHRDVKPSNVFLVGGRAVLTDFGVAKSRTRPGEALTGAGQRVGTPEYMAPEQAAGGEVTPRSDVYSAGMVLYESLTRREWPLVDVPERANWSGVPPELRPVLQRALAWTPGDRWADAGEFRAALLAAYNRGRRVRVRWLKRGVGAALGVAGVAMIGHILHLWDLWPDHHPLPTASALCIDRFTQYGGAGRAWIADSLHGAVLGELSGFVDFGVRRGTGCDLDFGGQVGITGDSVRLQLVLRPGGGPLRPVDGTVLRWPAVADVGVDRIVTEVWARENPLAGSLPPLPRTPQGKAAELRAERLQAAGKWTEALAAYRQAEAVDSTCWLCAWRITDVQRWLGQPLDPRESRSYLVHIDSFPPRYRSLIRAGQVPMPQRLDTLERAVQDQSFFLAWFHLGDELFHRGPLYGRARREAVERFLRTVTLRPDYAPGWEHLAYVRIAIGDSAGAQAALSRFKRLGDSTDAMSGVLQGFHEVGFAWRFRPRDEAVRVTEQVLDVPVVAAFPYLAAGPRLLPTVGAPDGAVWLGNRFAATAGRADLQRSGLIAATMGWLALGRVDSCFATAARLRQQFPDAAITGFVAQLRVAIAVFDSATVPLQGRATWLDGLRGSRPMAGAPVGVRRLLQANSLARRGDAQAALAASATLALDSAALDADPFLRTAVFLRRAEWAARTNDVDLARRTLSWHEHSSLEGWPTGDPQANDVDWAFGTLADWRLARLLDRAGETGMELCDAYRNVARLWRNGDAMHAVRADSARVRFAELRCGRAQP